MLKQLIEKYSWPLTKPNISPDGHGWIDRQEMSRAVELIRDPSQVKIVVEIGTWLGLSARWFCEEFPNCKMICIDHWLGSGEHKITHPDKLPTLWETFVATNWEYRNRMIPMKADSLDALRQLHACKIIPDILYIDGEHTAERVFSELSTAVKLFPAAFIMGHDFDKPAVAEGIKKTGVDIVRTGRRVWYVKKRQS